MFFFHDEITNSADDEPCESSSHLFIYTGSIAQWIEQQKHIGIMWDIKKTISKGDYTYALVPNHPNATKNGYVLLHRIIVENHLGRLLGENEIVHHKDHNKKNNDISNLEVLTKDEHSRLHMYEKGKYYVKLKCPWCGKEFEAPRNKTHLVKHKTINCTFCSRHCSGSFSSERQYHGVTDEMKKAISENVICVYVKHGKD